MDRPGHRIVSAFILSLLVSLAEGTLPAMAEGPSPAQPAASQPVTLQEEATARQIINLAEAIQLAESHNPSLQAARQDLNVSQAEIRIAGYIPNPALLTYYGFGQQTTQMGNPQQVGLTQPLEIGGKRPLRVRIAKNHHQAVEADYQALRWSVRSDVRKAYTDLVTALELALAVGVESKNLGEFVRIAQKRYQAGVAPKSEVLQAELTYSQIQTERNRALGRIEQAKIRLNTLLGNVLPDNYTIEEIGQFTSYRLHRPAQLAPVLETAVPQQDKLLDLANTQRLELQSIAKRGLAAQQQLQLARRQRIPDLLLSSGYLFISLPARFAPTGKDDFFGGGFVSLGLNLPIYNNQQGEIARATAAIERNRLEAVALRQQINGEVKTALVALNTATRNIQQYRTQLLPDAEDVLRLAQESYELGKAGLSSVIVAQQGVQEVIVGYLTAIAEYQTAWSDLERAVGAPLTDRPELFPASPPAVSPTEGS
jgi:cobalt-zinc-cadmium efflux system outer membrane protein